MKVTFCGHRQISQRKELENWLREKLQYLIHQGATVFYLGGYGAFDHLAMTVLQEEKKLHPAIELILVLAYLNTKQDISNYDGTIYPPLETVPQRFAISHRNRWMVENSDVVIGYVTHKWGGAATTLQYAKQKKKKIFLFENQIT